MITSIFIDQRADRVRENGLGTVRLAVTEMDNDLTLQSSDRDHGVAPDVQPTAEVCAMGSRRAIEWFRRWRKPLRSWIRRGASMPLADADDLTQEVFVRLLRYSNHITVENPQSYLFSIATNVVRAWRERACVRMEHDDVWLEELRIDGGQEPENLFARSQAHQEILAAVDALPPRQREILLLHVNEGLTYKQIAQLKGLTYRIVLRDLTRAYASLRGQLIAEDLTPPNL